MFGGLVIVKVRQDTWSFGLCLVKNNLGGLIQCVVVVPPFLTIRNFWLFTTWKKKSVMSCLRARLYNRYHKVKLRQSNEKFACHLPCIEINVFENSSSSPEIVKKEKKKKKSCVCSRWYLLGINRQNIIQGSANSFSSPKLNLEHKS